MSNGRLQFRSEADLMVGLALMAEAAVEVQPVGGNMLRVRGDLSALDGEQRDQLARLVGHGVDYEPADGSTPPEASDGTQQSGWVGEMPPRSGTGATRDAWAAFADTNDVPYPADATRDQIIEAVEAHRGS